ncbi:NAD(P)-dependent oxidoreductase [Micromonospora sp. NPDC047134]|uniref:NAD(P)-dependent oxidoreductase n=1 Tax=Micromonospora sp. NPDC047134 TaxID=3154340 RepID=UPI0033FD51D9
MSRIALLGLGRMGSQMALRLLDEGHQLTLWNRSGVPDVLQGTEATAAPTPSEAARGAEIVITMLTDGAAVTDVLFGSHGAVNGLSPEAVLVDMSTIGPAAVAELRARLAPQLRFIDAPVQGSTPKARAGELVILAGGAPVDVDHCRPALESLGKLRHVGALGAGASAKLVVNLALGSSFVVLGEALRLSDHLDLDAEMMLDVLTGTAVGSLVPRLRARLSNPDAPTQFSVGLAAKDLRLVGATGALDDGAVAGAERMLTAAADAGYGEMDITVLPAFLRGGKDH